MPGALFYLLGLPVTAYALGMAASLLLSAALLLVCAGRAGIPQKTAETFLLLALPLGLIAARLAYVLVRLPFFLDRGDGLAFRFWQGGTTLWGALAGFLLAAWLTARLEHMETGRLLDAFAPAGLLLLALGRFCEGLAGQGFGEEALPQLSFFPFAVPNEWGEWRWAVFLLSGLAALLFILPVLRAKGLQPGGRAKLALILVCAFQILFESFREDEFLRWGFVRAGQLIPAGILLLVMLSGLYGRDRGRWQGPPHQALAVFVMLTLVAAACEYALDKTAISALLIYLVMLLAALGMYALARHAALEA